MAGLRTLLAVAAVAVAVALPPGIPDVVKTTSGAVSGVRAGNLRYYLAVPFAATTAGANAFNYPMPPEPWTGTLDCSNWGAGCFSPHHNPDVPSNTSFACLNVNIFAPSTSTGPLPVMVFFNGGAFLEGSNQGPFDIYAGDKLATQGDVLVISANYRLGPFGWAYLGNSGVPANLGLHDQIAALQWVQANAAAFGGDPARVTVFGESAGAMSIGILMTSPHAQGLFSQAVLESNPAGFVYKTTEQASVYGATYCGLMGCNSTTAPGGCDVSCLRNASTANPGASMSAWDTATNSIPDFLIDNLPHILDGLLGTTPVIDGDWIPKEPQVALAEGGYWAQGMPIMLGTNAAEGSTFIYAAINFELPGFLIPPVYFAFLGWNATNAAAVNAQPAYNSSAFADGRVPLSQAVTDFWFRCASERFLFSAHAAGGASTYLYKYTHLYSNSSIFPEFGLPQICAEVACHASELPFVFGNVPSFTSFTPAEQVLSDQMVAYWTNFAKTGNPNGAGPSNVTWPAWDPVGRRSVVLDTPISTESAASLCSFWDSLNGGVYNW